jgi:hypothetical protein
MDFIANILLAGGALALAVYCFILQRKLTRFSQLENGMGGAIAVLSAQVDDLTRILGTAQQTASTSTQRLEDLTQRAETASARLEILMSSLHDLPGDEPSVSEPERRARFVRHRSRRDWEASQ